MKIEKFSKDDLLRNMNLFCDLYHKVYTADANRAIISQRYLENPYDELMMYVAMDDKRIVANYSVVPIRVMIDGKEYKAAQSLNTMTDPDYEGQGLFTQLATSLYDHLEKSEYSMVIGFPNYIANRTFNTRLSWQTVYEVPTLRKELDVQEQIKTEQTEAESQIFGSSFDNVNCGITDSRVHVHLSKEYINWRFRDNKEKKYHVLSLDENNWIIYHFYKDEINITELSGDNETDKFILISELIKIGRQKGFRAVTTWATPNTAVHSQLEKLGFRLASPVRTFGLRCFEPNYAEIVFDYRNWSIQMGDDNTY